MVNLVSRKFPIAEGEFYHIFNRGVDKRVIFENKKDYERFQASLFVYNSSDRVAYRSISSDPFEYNRGEIITAVGAYCLMSNHFHLLIREVREGGISKFMQKITTSYTMYFNTKYERSGSLFQGGFKSKHVNTDEYLKYIYSYIHLNPISRIDPRWDDQKIVSDKDKAEKFLNKYPYSSFLDYAGTGRPQEKIIDRNPFPEYFQSKKDFNDIHRGWLKTDSV